MGGRKEEGHKEEAGEGGRRNSIKKGPGESPPSRITIPPVGYQFFYHPK